MNFYTTCILGALAAAMPFALSAQDITGAATLGFASVNGSAADVDDAAIRSLDGQLNLKYDNGLMLGAKAASARADIDGLEEDTSVNVFGLTAGAGFANFWNGGAYYEFGDISEDGFGNESIDSYGLFLGYASDLMAFELFGGSTDGYALSGADVDWTDLGARASFNIGTLGVVGGHIQRSRLSEGGDTVDLTSFGLGGQYTVAPGLNAFAGFTSAEIDELAGELTTFGIGIGYDLSAATNFPAILSLELARTRLSDDVDSIDEDSIRFGLTLPLGGAKTLPLNSAASNAMSPNRTALTTALVGSF
jgi:hypothetical protein